MQHPAACLGGEPRAQGQPRQEQSSLPCQSLFSVHIQHLSCFQPTDHALQSAHNLAHIAFTCGSFSLRWTENKLHSRAQLLLAMGRSHTHTHTSNRCPWTAIISLCVGRAGFSSSTHESCCPALTHASTHQVNDKTRTKNSHDQSDANLGVSVCSVLGMQAFHTATSTPPTAKG